MQQNADAPADKNVCDVHDINVDGVSLLVKTGGIGGVAKEVRVSS
jgi:hypothetical protein